MPPRRSSAKKKNTRRDAALDAMLSFGFSKDLILKKLKELLAVYGEDNWKFIEENSYEVLRDNILEQVEQDERQRKDDTDVALLPSSSNAMALDIAPQTNEFIESTLPINGALDTPLLTCESDITARLRPSGEGTSWKQDINLDQNAREKHTTEIVETGDGNVIGADHIGNDNLSPPHASYTPKPEPVHNVPIHNLSPPHGSNTPKPVNNVPIQRRRRYHGWIDSDDEDNEMVELDPAPLPDNLAKLFFVAEKIRKGKTRWDLKPEDLKGCHF